MTVHRRLLTLCLSLFLTIFGTAAFADTFSLDASGNGVTVDATLTATQTSPNTFNVTGISGTVTDPYGTFAGTHNIDALFSNSNPPTIVTSPDGGWLFDNVAYTSGSGVDYYGLGFTFAGEEANLYFDSSYGAYFFGYGNPNSGDGYPNLTELSSFSLTPVPEPTSLLLLGSGALGLAGMIRRKLLVV